MILVQGYARFEPGEIARLKPELEAMMAASRAEPGCEAYCYAVDLGDSDSITICERWADQAALDAHFETPHMARLGAVLGTARIRAIKIDAWEGSFLRTVMGV